MYRLAWIILIYIVTFDIIMMQHAVSRGIVVYPEVHPQ